MFEDNNSEHSKDWFVIYITNYIALCAINKVDKKIVTEIYGWFKKYQEAYCKNGL